MCSFERPDLENHLNLPKSLKEIFRIILNRCFWTDLDSTFRNLLFFNLFVTFRDTQFRVLVLRWPELAKRPQGDASNALFVYSWPLKLAKWAETNYTCAYSALVPEKSTAFQRCSSFHRTVEGGFLLCKNAHGCSNTPLKRRSIIFKLYTLRTGYQEIPFMASGIPWGVL